MEVIYARCGALDVHKKTVVAGVRLAEANKVTTDVKTFATTTKGLLALSDWLAEHGITHVVMEATGVYWKPVWQVLSAHEEFALALANAAHVKNVPGRKSDVSDTDWLLGAARARPDPAELRSRRGDAGTAHPDALAQAVGSRADAPHPAHSQDAGRSQHQARQCPLRYPRQERACDARCHRRRRDRSGPTGRPRPSGA